MDKRGGVAKYPLRRRPSATSGLKVVSVYNGEGAVDFSDRAKKARRLQEEELVVVERVREERSDGLRVGGSSVDVDREEKVGGSEMVDGSEGEEATRQPKRVAKIYNHGKELDDCNPVDPATVPRKLRSAMNKRNRESISPPLPESKKYSGSNGSRLASMAYANGTKKSRQGLKQANAVDRSPRQAVSMTVTKTEEEVAEALYDLSRMFTTSPVGSKSETIEEAKPLPSPEERSNKLSFDSPAEAPSKMQAEMINAPATDALRSPSEVTISAEPASTAQPATISFIEKLDLESHARMDQQNNAAIEKKSSAPPLTDVSNVLLPSRGDSEKGSAQPPITNLLLPHDDDKGPLLSEFFTAKRVEPSEISERSASCGRMSGVVPSLRHNVTNGSYIHLDLSGPSLAKTAAWQDSAMAVTKATTPTGTYVDSGKQSWKRCVAHVHLSHFIRGHQSDSKVPKWAILSSQQQSKVNGDAKKAGCGSVHNHGISSTSTVDSSTERSRQNGCLQLLQEKIPALDQMCAQDAQGIDFLSLSPSDGDGAKLGNLNSGVESSVPVHTSFMNAVQPQSVSPFSIQPARFHSAYTDQQVQVQFQVQLPQYLANPFINPHFAAAAAAAAAATTPAGKQQPQQLWASQMAQYHQAAQFPKWQNGRNDTASFLPCSQPGSSLDPLSTTYAQSQQLFPLTPARNKSQQQSQQRKRIFRSEGPTQLQLLSNGDRT